MGWIVQEKAGRTFDVLIQDQEADCGLCCVAMVVNLIVGGKPTSAMVKKNLPTGAYSPSTKDRVGFAPSLLSSVLTDTSFHSTGTYLTSLQGALAAWKIKSEYCSPSSNVQQAILNAKAGEPIICHVTWNNGVGHWVVITHSMGNSHYILDPYWGLQINSDTTQYKGLLQSPLNAGSVTPVTYGTWSGEWLKITGTG
ncbi:Papain-like cysteine protease AvrRpt2 [Novosphingobium sp. CF614]|uniref:hypothetical protein n=1 Tax=Novosphingobium sp. CF614 TaxID=1884364 RepID=UPI0008E87410|nr:hypothetical protein [Novosphingobium sp. CF614]SFG41477.1 Papain-like cysteine protease AvrRpt2 [Novosphingobium sp. CF614]